MATALVIGATGLVGSALLRQLLSDERVTQVVSLGRRASGLASTKLTEHVVDFDRPETWAGLVRGDVLFSTLGTTRKQAGGTEAQYRVDYTYQYEVARAAAGNGVPTYVLVSSAGADPSSRLFYPRIKGELERDVQQLGFRHVHILRPGPLEGVREVPRLGERIGIAAIRVVNALGLGRDYRPISGELVARAMIRAAFERDAPVSIVGPGELFTLAERA